MECIEPGLVTADELMAYAAGDAGARVGAHIAACAACAEQATAYIVAERTLQQRLFRVDCPAILVLGELALDMLDPAEALEMRAHLALCPHCTAELATL